MQQSPPPAPQTAPAPVTHAPPPTAAHGAGPASLLTDPRWQTWGVWGAVAVSVIGGTLWLGRLDGQLSALDDDKLIDTRDAAVAAIKAARKEAEQAAVAAIQAARKEAEQAADAAVAEAMQARTADAAWLARVSAGVSAQPVPGTATTFAQVAQQSAAQGTELQALQQAQAELRQQLAAIQAAPGDGDKALATRLAKLEADLKALAGRVAGIEARMAVGPDSPPVRPAGPAVFQDTLKDGGQGPKMVALPGDTFLMGSPDAEPERSPAERPQRQVTITPFAIGQTEVTFAEYDRFAKASGRPLPDDRGWGRGARPVINVSWHDATAYAAWLSEQTGQVYRLPSEAEWEYAARAGSTTPFWTGGCIHTDQANFNGNNDYNHCGAKTGVYRQQTVPAGSLPANAFGLHEVAGNAWEWVADCSHGNYEGAPTDGSAWLDADGGDCARRVLRGGSWGDDPRNLRAAIRLRNAADAANGFVGFRLARTLPF